MVNNVIPGGQTVIKVCFWCQKPKDIDASEATDTDAPIYTLMDYEPCEPCKGMMADGILLIEAARTPNHEGQGCMNDKAYPTGRWTVVKETSINGFLDPEIIPATLEARACFLDPETYSMIIDEKTADDPMN